MRLGTQRVPLVCLISVAAVCIGNETPNGLEMSRPAGQG